ncbi:MAG: response regulator [Acidobacteriota bacterium]|jgi:two-component system, chemotaxis family, chemotaxis protein CheY
MKVLTVDDSRMIRTLIRKYLASLKLEILEAADGQAGLEVARNTKPDLVILDINMPVMDGTEMLRELRKVPELSKTKVLMLTAESAEKLVLEVIKIGISDYIVKPFEEDVLIKKVRKILQIDPSQSEEGNGESGMTKVLVLDDNESILLVARRFLAGVADVLTTSRPEKALQLASQHSPEVVLLDLQTDAFKMLNTMKKESGLSAARFVCLATRSAADKATEVQEAGFADVLYKPFDKETLTKAIQG